MTEISQPPSAAYNTEYERKSLSQDDQLLESLGYTPELKREFSYLTVFGQVCFST